MANFLRTTVSRFQRQALEVGMHVCVKPRHQGEVPQCINLPEDAIGEILEVEGNGKLRVRFDVSDHNLHSEDGLRILWHTFWIWPFAVEVVKPGLPEE